jgi:hypothetical protein
VAGRVPIAAVVLSSPTRSSLRLNAYVSTEKTGQAKGDRFVAASGINGCIPEFAEKQMRDNRKRWDKNGERIVEKNGRKAVEGVYVQAYHVIQSFARDGRGSLDPDSSEDWEIAHENGIALARKLAGKTRLATVHTQVDGKTGCVHNHIVIDSVDRQTGRSFDSSNVKHKLLAVTHDSVLAEAGFEQVNELTTGAEKVEKSELRGLAKHQQWEAGDKTTHEPFSVAVLKHRIQNALADTTFTSWDEFEDAAEMHGVDAQQRGESGRGISYAMLRNHSNGDDYLSVSRSDIRKASTLGRDFLMGAVEAAIARNLATQQAQQSGQPAHQAASPVQAAAAIPQAKRVQAQSVTAREPQEASTADQVAGAESPTLSAPMASVAEPDTREHEESTLSPAPVEDARKSSLDSRRAAQDELEEEVPTQSSHHVPSRPPAGRVTLAPPVSRSPTPVITGSPYSSPLRRVRVKTEKQQAIVDQAAAFDELAKEPLARGERLDESSVPKGIGPRFLDTLGDRFDPVVLSELALRQIKKARASALFDTAKAAAERLEELRLRGEREDPTGWYTSTEAVELKGRARIYGVRQKALRDQIAAGVYEEVSRLVQPTIDTASDVTVDVSERDGPSL